MTHPCNCKTCKVKPCPALEVIRNKPYCDNFGTNFWWDKAGLVTSIVGCNYHQNARETLMAPVIKELERLYDGNAEESGTYTEGKADGYDRAITLIRDGVKV